jgi:hypothetical protein
VTFFEALAPVPLDHVPDRDRDLVLAEGGARTWPASAGEFEGKVALVTGGASGIGAAAVALLRERGAQVASFDLQPATGGDGVLAVPGDATDSRSVDEGVARAERELGPARRGRVLRGHGRRLRPHRRHHGRGVAAGLRAELRRGLLLQPRGRAGHGPRGSGAW